MGSKLGVQHVARLQQLDGTGFVANIGGRFAGKDRVMVKAFLLGGFDFGIPVSPFYQPHHQWPFYPPGKLHQPLDNKQGAFLIRLHRQTKAAPVTQRIVAVNCFNDIQGQIKPVCFFGINGKANVIAFGYQYQLFQLWQ